MTDPFPLLKRLQPFEFLRDLAENTVWKVFAPNAVIFWEGDVIERRRWTNQTELAAHTVRAWRSEP